MDAGAATPFDAAKFGALQEKAFPACLGSNERLCFQFAKFSSKKLKLLFASFFFPVSPCFIGESLDERFLHLGK